MDKLVALVGVDNLVVVDTPDALLVAQRSRAQDVSKVVKAWKPGNGTTCFSVAMHSLRLGALARFTFRSGGDRNGDGMRCALSPEGCADHTAKIAFFFRWLSH